MSQNKDWRLKAQEVLKLCQEEIVRTTEIGKKMLTASKASSDLHQNYEALGELLARALKSGEHTWNHPEVEKIMEEISNCEDNIEKIDLDVNKIRFKEEKNPQE